MSSTKEKNSLIGGTRIMAVDRTPILKRCRSLGMEPMYLGVNKKSNRKLNRANRKVNQSSVYLSSIRTLNLNRRVLLLLK